MKQKRNDLFLYAIPLNNLKFPFMVMTSCIPIKGMPNDVISLYGNLFKNLEVRKFFNQNFKRILVFSSSVLH